ncbi:PREDICTED: uncharacterized protein LOC104732890 [Camelina sativa]|uniref:Uncharacterized protein LOC104732890 n=1 Tax=Camelina sativa TaxID=90675 RepID=A0ABM0V4W1_CAMSA|nr:PREDICTED: uncharacterized protein LOC104732890 [Camelina sativa]
MLWFSAVERRKIGLSCALVTFGSRRWIGNLSSIWSGFTRDLWDLFLYGGDRVGSNLIGLIEDSIRYGWIEDLYRVGFIEVDSIRVDCECDRICFRIAWRLILLVIHCRDFHIMLIEAPPEYTIGRIHWYVNYGMRSILFPWFVRWVSRYDLVLVILECFVMFSEISISDRFCLSLDNGCFVQVVFIRELSLIGWFYNCWIILSSVGDLSDFLRELCLAVSCFSDLKEFWLCRWWSIMSQLALNKGKAPLVRTETVRIANSVLAQRIQQFSLTLIGRLMNPSVQQMESLVANLPKIWKLEDKVVGADLGQGLFQFNFEAEEELQAVLMNGPYHFDGWMLALVKWEPIISSTYPSAINFWVKVTGIPMHLWEEATLRAIGKKVGILREIDEETGSFCVTVNGFNPLLFKMVVPFEFGDEVIVSLEYEKLTGFCEHCSRLTHDVRECPELKKGAGEQVAEQQVDKRFVLKHHLQGKQGGFKSEGGWEKPRKHVKRALDFQGHEGMHGDGGAYGSRYQERFQGSTWGQKKQFTAVESSGSGGQRGSQMLSGELEGQVPSFNLNRKGMGPVWPKPLYKVKQGSAVKQNAVAKRSQEEEDAVGRGSTSQAVTVAPEETLTGLVKEGEETGFMEENDDLLEEGEYPEGDDAVIPDTELGKEDDTLTEQGTDSQSDMTGDSQGAGKKQKSQGRQDIPLRGKPADGSRQVKKGTVALPKPPAHT